MKISFPGMDRAVAQDLVAKAHIVCPYSNATRGNIGVRLSIAAVAPAGPKEQTALQ